MCKSLALAVPREGIQLIAASPKEYCRHPQVYVYVTSSGSPGAGVQLIATSPKEYSRHQNRYMCKSLALAVPGEGIQPFCHGLPFLFSET